jgi:hypothetical protein
VFVADRANGKLHWGQPWEYFGMPCSRGLQGL